MTPKFWLKGGLGFSQAYVRSDSYSDSVYGLALAGSGGLEVLQRRNFAIDLSGRLSVLDFGDSSTLSMVCAVFGFRWR